MTDVEATLEALERAKQSMTRKFGLDMPGVRTAWVLDEQEGLGLRIEFALSDMLGRMRYLWQEAQNRAAARALVKRTLTGYVENGAMAWEHCAHAYY